MGASHSSRDGSNHFQQAGQGTNRQREGYSIEVDIRNRTLSRPGSGSASRPGTKHGKGPDRKREEPADSGHKERADTSSEEVTGGKDQPMNGYGENVAGEVDWDGLGESTEEGAVARAAVRSNDQFDTNTATGIGGGSCGNPRDASYDGFGDRFWDCAWCSSDSVGRTGAPQSCPKHELLHTIALQELAIAHLINAQAEQVQAITKQTGAPLKPDELIELQHSITSVMQLAMETEKLLLNKLRLLFSKSGSRSGSGRSCGS